MRDVDLVALGETREPEVGDLDDVVGADEDVGGAQVTVHVVLVLEVRHAVRDLRAETLT